VRGLSMTSCAHAPCLRVLALEPKTRALCR
jgi:hypothetical protein